MVRNLQMSLLALACLALAAAAQDKKFVLADFEAGGPTNNLFGYWFYYNDAANQGNSRITTCDTISGGFDTTSIGPGRNGSVGAGRMGFVFGDKMPVCGDSCAYDPEVGFGTDLRSTDSTADLSGATYINFWARSNHPLTVLFTVTLLPVKDYAHYRQTITTGPEWKQYSIALKKSPQFSQPTWGKPVAWDPRQITTINWVVTKAFNKALASDTLMVDDIEVMEWDPFATSIRAARAPGARGLRVSRGAEGLRLLLPEDMRGRDGVVRVGDLMGREVARAPFRKGEDRLLIGSASLRGSQGPFYINALPQGK